MQADETPLASSLPRIREPLEGLYLPKAKATSPRARDQIWKGARQLLSPQPRSNAGILDDLVSEGIPKLKKANRIYYESSVLSPLNDVRRVMPVSRRDRVHEEKSVADSDTTIRRQKRVLASYGDVKQVVQGLDTARTGDITARDLGNALNRLGIKMRKTDFARLVSEVDPAAQQATHLPALGRVPEEPARRREAVLPKLGKGSKPTQKISEKNKQTEKLASASSWRDMLAKMVSRRWKQLQRDFKRLDPHGSGHVDMRALLVALEIYGVVLKTEDADALYLQMGIGRTGKIHWGEFLKYFANAGLQRPGAISAPPGLTSVKGGFSQGGMQSKHTDRMPPAVQEYLRIAALQWRSIRQACKIMDKGLAKTMTRQKFKGILRKVGASASDPVLDAVCGYYRGSEIVDDPLAQKSESDLVEYTRFIKDIAQLFPSM